MAENLDDLFPWEEVPQRKAFLRRFWDLSQPVERHAEVFWRSEANLSSCGPAEEQLAESLRCIRDHRDVGGDFIPFLNTYLGTPMLASAFGCEVVRLGTEQPWALPLIADYDPEAVLALKPPSPEAGLCGKNLEITSYLNERTEGRIPVRVGDLQGPLGVAGQVWKDEHFFAAMLLDPEAAHHLLNLTTNLIVEYVKAHRTRCQEQFTIHCPHLWMPPEMGIGLSEDYLPVLSPHLYAEFGVPYVNRLAQEFGGVYIHCCGNFEHNFENLLQIENLRGIQVCLPEVSWEKLEETFGGRTVLVPLGSHNCGQVFGGNDGLCAWVLAHTRPGTRLLLWR